MAIKYVNLPLYSDSNYEYMVALERVTYKIHLYYNDRMEKWIYDIKFVDDTPVVLGEALSDEYPLMYDYELDELSGFLYLAPIGENQNQTLMNPFEIYKYYRLYYFYDDGA